MQGSDFTNGDIEHVRFPDSMQRVLDIVRSVESMPSCAKIATSNLMHSCSSLEGSILNEDAELNRGSDLFIADEMGLYAARLAVCELNEAGSTIPNGCEAFVPSQGMKKQSGFRSFWTRAGPTNPTPCYGCYDDVTQAQSKQCINALYSVPQTWTSFSNSKQNAVTICRAMRSEIDREEQVHISEILAETAVAATDNLRDAYKQANQVKAQFEEIRSALPKFHQDLVDGNEMLLMQVKQLWTELQQGLNAISDIRNNVQAANEDINNLHSSIKAATDESLATVHEGLHGMESQVTIMFGTLQSLHTTMNFEAEYGSNLIAQVLSAIARNMSLAHGETSLIAEQTREKLLELNATMSSFPMVLAAEWAGAHEWLQAMKTFSSYVVVYTLLGFGVWEKFMRFSIVGSIFASLGSGIGKAPWCWYF